MQDKWQETSDDHDRLPKAKSSKKFYRRNLPHLQKPGRPIFITFHTRRGIVLPESIRAQVLRHCLHDHGRKIHMHCAVVMPDHVHLLLSLLEDEDGTLYGLAEVMKAIKGTSNRTVNRALKRKGSLWQDESFDHILRTDRSIRAKSEYICDNPVRKAIVSHQDDYPWLWREWVEGERRKTTDRERVE